MQRVIEALGAETDLVLITAMDFDDRAALDAGLASDAMRAAGRNLREIAPGLATLLVLEEAGRPGADAGAHRWSASANRASAPFPERDWTGDTGPATEARDHPRGVRVTDVEPTTRLIRVEAPVGGHDGVALVTIDRPEARNALNFALLAELADQLETLDVDDRIRVVVLTGAGDRAFAAGADIVELADQSPERLHRRGRASRPGTASARSACRSSRRSAASRWAVVASWP